MQSLVYHNMLQNEAKKNINLLNHGIFYYRYLWLINYGKNLMLTSKEQLFQLAKSQGYKPEILEEEVGFGNGL